MDILIPASIVQTSDGGFAIAINNEARRVDNIGYQGHFTQFYELQIMKTNSNGEVQWRKNFTQVDDPNGQTSLLYIIGQTCIIVQTADQGYTIASSGYDKLWMFKVDAQGNVLWSKNYIYNEETPSQSFLNAMIQTNDGGFALAGTTQTSEGGNDFWLVKTDSTGKAQWNQTYNSGAYIDSMGNEYPREDEAKSIVQTQDGGYAIVGSASLYRASTSSIVYASWMAKTDSQGKPIWSKGYDFPNDSGRPFSIVHTSDGGYAITGTQNDDFFLMKINSTSQFQWSKTYGSESTDTPCTLVQLNDGGYAIFGTWTKVNATAIASTMKLLRLDSSGTMVWNKTYTAKENGSTISYDLANAMVRTSDGGYAMVGSTMFGSEYHQDVFLVKTEPLEQPPQPTPTPIQSTPEPSITPTPTLTSTPTQSLAPTQSQSPSLSNSPSQQPSLTPSPSIPEFSPWILLTACTTAALMLAITKKLKSNTNTHYPSFSIEELNTT
jgi:hypothetical protein